MRELSAIRNSRAKLRRSQKIRRSLALLNQYGVDRAQILELRQPYLLKTRDLLSQAAEIFPYLNPFDGLCESPWVTHSAPFTGYSWAFNWHRTSNPRNPVLERYLDTSTGRIGSSIETKVSGAGDDDELVAEYYAGLNVWHTPQMTGPLEVYLTFEFTTSNYSGKVSDEFGFSDVTHSQWATARMLASDSQDPIQTEAQESVIYGFTDFLWGEDDSWSRQVANPRDLHSYYFKTAATFQQGSSVLLEAGIRQMTWFQTNDESISTAADLDLRLDQIKVRSCRAEMIL